MKKALEGEEVQPQDGAVQANAEGEIDFDAFTEDSELTYGYCTEFLLRLQNQKCDIDTFDLEELTAFLNRVGNSVVSFREGSIVKVHVHTMDPGEVLSHCRQYGEFLKLKIENMNLQHNETIENEDPAQEMAMKRHKKYGVVTVANGEGLKNLFSELGADVVIEGGQSMNPSAESFLKAFRSLNVDYILVFPNNSNIIATAEQAKELFNGAPVTVVKTRNIGEGYSAIAMLDTTMETPEEVEAEANEAIRSTVSGMVSVATRNSSLHGVSVKEGDYIGFSGDAILSEAEQRIDAAEELIRTLQEEEHDIALIIRGKEVAKEEAEELRRRVERQFPDTEAIVVDGMQPIYDYIVILQ